MLCSGNAVCPVEYTCVWSHAQKSIHLRPAELDQAHSMRGLTTDLRQVSDEETQKDCRRTLVCENGWLAVVAMIDLDCSQDLGL
jgi:hypothetical protein